MHYISRLQSDLSDSSNNTCALNLVLFHPSLVHFILCSFILHFEFFVVYILYPLCLCFVSWSIMGSDLSNAAYALILVLLSPFLWIPSNVHIALLYTYAFPISVLNTYL
jgi:hypothetical protein